MNRKELIKLLDKYKIEYEITDNTKEVEEGLRLLDEALKKIGIIIPKETQVDTITTENDTEVPKHTTEWANSDDLISRQAAIEAMAPFDTNHELRDTLESLPPVEPPKKVIAQIKVDTEEIVERIKEEYEITDRPVCEDCISRADTVNALCQKCGLEHKCGGADCHENWCTEVKVVMGMPSSEPKPVCEDAISRADTIHAMCKECEKESGLNGECPVDCTEVAVVKSMPPAESKRPKSEWVLECDAEGYGDNLYRCSECGQQYGCQEYDLANFCPNCGAYMKGDAKNG